MPVIKIIYHNPDIDHIAKIDKGDWIDLRAAQDYYIPKGEFAFIDLGVSMKLPEGYEAHIAPRSSTFKNYGIIQTNSVGLVDNSYSGTNDIWKMPVYATRDTFVHRNDRICQFRIVEKMPAITFEEVKELDSENRSGFGSSGL